METVTYQVTTLDLATGQLTTATETIKLPARTR